MSFVVFNFLFLATLLSTTSLNFFKSTETVFTLPTSKSFAFPFKSFKPVGTLTILLISRFSASAFFSFSFICPRISFQNRINNKYL